MNKFTRVFLFLLAFSTLLSQPLHAADTYHVNKLDPNCDNASTGKLPAPAAPWCTIALIDTGIGAGHGTLGKVNTTNFAAGDTILFVAGTYDEVITPSAGSVGTFLNPITFSGNSVAPWAAAVSTIRRAILSGRTGIRITGFNITKQATLDTGNPMIQFANGATDCIVDHNYLHDWNSPFPAIRNGTPTFTNGLWIHHNKITLIGNVGSRNNGIQLNGSNTLIEYNDISHTQDFVFLQGNHNVVRYNIFHDSPRADAGSNKHNDGVQSTCNKLTIAINQLVLEGNYEYNMPDIDTHFALFNGNQSCTVTRGFSYVITRQNVITDMGTRSYVADLNPNVTSDCFDVDVPPTCVPDDPALNQKHKYYNNTHFKIGCPFTGCGVSVTHTTVEIHGTSNGAIVNNVFVDAIADSSSLSTMYALGTGLGNVGHHNLGYFTANPMASWAATAIGAESPSFRNIDPVFVNPTGEQPDLHLQASSTVKDSGSHLTTVASGCSGSATSITLTDASWFQDGWGPGVAAGVLPDFIAVGTVGNTVQILANGINYTSNVVMLANAIACSDGDLVWLQKNSIGSIVLSGPGPSLGAYEYGGGPSLSLSGIAPAFGPRNATTAVTISGGGFTSGSAAVTTSCGTDITVSNTMVVSDNSITADFAIAAMATLASCTVTVTTNAGVSNGVTFAITASNGPTITTIGPDRCYKATTCTFTITGTNLGGASPIVAVSGSGLTVQNLAVVGTTVATGQIVVAADAEIFARDLTFTSAAGTSNIVAYQPLSSGLGPRGRLLFGPR